MNKRGFTLIELLVVISILGVLAAMIVNNLNDSRARARDARKKQNLNQMKTALRLYYNDFQVYPAAFSSWPLLNYIKGCGADGDENCPCSGSNNDFASGSDCETIYMVSFPDGFGNNTIAYYSDNSETFCLKTSLENASDPDIQTSIDQCSSPCADVGGGVLASPTYAVCAD
jgi:prepilin-type N-terminal cleavage/methylation domain-containing protein